MRQTATQDIGGFMIKKDVLRENQYVSLFLPLARLLLSTFLPSAVFILFLKPCSFFLCLFLGWYVLSIICTSLYYYRKRVALKAFYAFTQ